MKREAFTDETFALGASYYSSPLPHNQEQQKQQDFGFYRNSIARLPKYTISHLTLQAEFVPARQRRPSALPAVGYIYIFIWKKISQKRILPQIFMQTIYKVYHPGALQGKRWRVVCSRAADVPPPFCLLLSPLPRLINHFPSFPFTTGFPLLRRKWCSRSRIQLHTATCPLSRPRPSNVGFSNLLLLK